MKNSLHSNAMTLLQNEPQVTSFFNKSFKENVSNSLKPLPKQNLNQISLNHVQSFYIQKMADFGFTGFETPSLDSNFTSRSDTDLSAMNSRNFDDIKNLSSSRNRLSALTHRDIGNNKSDIKNDLELIPSFKDKIKYLKEIESHKKIYNINNNPKQKPQFSQLAKPNSSAKSNSLSLNICK